eukprot:c33214_g1_i1 orf=52-207(+)
MFYNYSKCNFHLGQMAPRKAFSGMKLQFNADKETVHSIVYFIELTTIVGLH